MKLRLSPSSSCSIRRKSASSSTSWDGRVRAVSELRYTLTEKGKQWAQDALALSQYIVRRR